MKTRKADAEKHRMPHIQIEAHGGNLSPHRLASIHSHTHTQRAVKVKNAKTNLYIILFYHQTFSVIIFSIPQFNFPFPHILQGQGAAGADPSMHQMKGR